MAFEDERDYEEERANERLMREEGQDPWIVCPDCNGEGKHALHGIAFTADEMREQGEEFLEDYLAGEYDTPCETCNGRTTIKKSREEQYYEDMRDHRTMMMESGIYDW